MAKLGVPWQDARGILSVQAAGAGWVLCVGAGISRPAFPMWSELVHRLIERDPTSATVPNLADSLLRKFSPDSLISAARDRLDIKDSEEFAKVLAEELYTNIREKTGANWPVVADALTRKHAGEMSNDRWKLFLDVMHREFPGMSAIRIAHVLADLTDTPTAPSSIISFNAEPSLYALINAVFQSRVDQRGTNGGVSARQRFAPIVRAISNRAREHIPFYYCHGLLKVPDAPRAMLNADAHEKLVFSENEYLSLANRSYSWQSEVFLSACSHHAVVFAGVSLSDSNMRRWLTWVHQNRADELQSIVGKENSSTRHYWIEIQPPTRQEAQWLESSVAHLGVRIIWLDEWKNIGLALQNLIGVTTPGHAG